ncbi:MAG: PAS domain S-box protein [Elusimicrobiota bacterium]
MTAHARKTGIDVIGDAPWGTHFCHFCRTKEDLSDVLVPYFKAGLESNEFCMWIASDPLGAEDAKSSLREAVKDLDEHIRRGRIEILDAGRWYTPSGSFDADSVLKGWLEKEEHALRKGFDGLRLSGNIFWLEKKDWKDFAAHEEAVNGVIGEHRMLAMCSYALERCDAAEVLEVAERHRFALIRREGGWKIFESQDRRAAAEALRRTSHQLGERVKELKCLFEATRIAMGPGTSIDEVVRGIALLIPPAWQYPDIARARITCEGRRFETPGFRETAWGQSADIMVSGKKTGAVEVYYLQERPAADDGPFLKEERDLLDALAREIGQSCEHKRAEDRLRLHGEIMAHMSEGVNLMRLSDGVIVYANPRFEKMFGYAPGELAGRHISIINAPTEKSPEETASEIIAALRREKSWRGEVKNIKKDGTPFWCSATVSLFDHPEYGTVAVSVQSDITERKRVERELLESEANYRGLFETSPGGIAVYEAVDGGSDFVFTDVNASVEVIDGVGRKRLLGKRVTEAFPGVEKFGLLDVFRRVWRTGKSEHHPLSFYEDGRIAGWRENFVYRLPSGKVVAVYRDVTERKRLEEEARTLQDRFTGLYESSKDAIVFADPDGTLTHINDAFCGLTGYPREELLAGKRYQDLTPNEYHGYEAGIVERVLRTGRPTEYEKEYIRKDGSRVPILLTTFVVKGSDGKPIGLAAIIKDIAERRRLEAEVLRISDWERRRIGNDLHDELGQKLTGVSLICHALQERLAARSDAGAGAATEIVRYVDEAVADVRRLAKGLVPVVAKPEGLMHALEGLASHVRSNFGVACRFRADQPVSLQDAAVATQLYRIAQEAAHNAARHAKASEISIGLEQREGTVLLTVEDDGVGLPDPSKRGDGMGLEIMRHRAGLVHGSLRIESGAGKGTKVVCSLRSRGQAAKGGA